MSDRIDAKLEQAGAACEAGNHDKAIGLLKEILAESEDLADRLQAAQAVNMVISQKLDWGYPNVGTPDYAEYHQHLKIMLDCYNQLPAQLQASFPEADQIPMFQTMLRQMEQGLPINEVNLRVVEDAHRGGVIQKLFGKDTLDVPLEIYLDDVLAGSGSWFQGIDVQIKTTVGLHKIRWKCARALDNLPFHKPDEYNANIGIVFEKPGNYEYRLGLSSTGLTKSAPELTFLA